MLFRSAATVAMKDICIARYEAFGSAGHANNIKPISCEKMAERYKKGQLNAIVNSLAVVKSRDIK